MASIVFGSTDSFCADSNRALNPEEVERGEHWKYSSVMAGKSPKLWRSVWFPGDKTSFRISTDKDFEEPGRPTMIKKIPK